MTTRTSIYRLWPHLKIRRFGRLDWPVMEYEPQPIAALGRSLQSAPQRPLDWALGQLLRELAQTPAALKALNRIPKRAPPATRELNIAVHHLALTRLKETPADALLSVGTAWGVRSPAVRQASREVGVAAAIELDALVEMCLARRRPHRQVKEVLRDVDADMRVRALQGGFKLEAARKR